MIACDAQMFGAVVLNRFFLAAGVILDVRLLFLGVCPALNKRLILSTNFQHANGLVFSQMDYPLRHR
jgi:hypothetical protein